MAYSIEQRDEQLHNTAAKIRYHLSFPLASQHLVHIQMAVETDAQSLECVMPSWLPGSYKVRDFVTFQGNLQVQTEAGEDLPFEWIAKNRVRVQTEGNALVLLRYVYYGHERTVRHSHIDRFHAFVNPGNCLMFVEGRMEEIHHVELDLDNHPSWSNVSTALSPVKAGVWGALNYDILIDSPIEIGNHYVAHYDISGAKHEVAITGKGNFDPDWITDRTITVVEHAVKMWGELPYDRYVWILQMLPDQYGGLEHARSQVSMFDANLFADKKKLGKFLALLTHEFFHTWNIKRIRPRELGPFNYNKENYTRMLWLAEGVTSYYDDLLTCRSGFYTRQEYLRALSEDHLSALFSVPGRLAMSIKDSSFLAWVKLYNPSPDNANRFPSYYLKGGIIFLLLDMFIIDKSGGEHSLDDGMRALNQHYKAQPETGVTEEEFVQIVSNATGVDVSEILLSWLNSTEELPLQEILQPLGLAWEAKEAKDDKIGEDIPLPSPTRTWVGLLVSEEPGRLKVSKVRTGSPAEEAGIGAEDEVLAIDGMRVGSTKAWKSAISRLPIGSEVRFTGASEGRLYETVLRSEELPVFHLVEISNPDADQKKKLAKWLGG